MSAWVLSTLAWFALVAQDGPPAPAPVVAQDPVVANGASVDLLGEGADRRFYTAKNLSAALFEAARNHGDIVRLESMGKSASGLELHVVTLARLGDDDPGDRPALLVVGALGEHDLFATEFVLATLRRTLQRAGRDAELDELLDRAVIYLVPCLDVDRREQAFDELGGHSVRASARSVGLDRNFPVDWNPLRFADAGSYPLSERESRALAQFALVRPNIGLVQVHRMSDMARRTSNASWPEPDRLALARVADELGFEGLEALENGDGSWLRFAYVQLGSFVVSAPAGFARHESWALPPVVDLPRLGDAAAASTLRLARALPRLRAECTASEALGPGQWQLEFEVENVGRLPTAAVQARARGACGAPTLELNGAELIGAALVVNRSPRGLPRTGQRVELPEIAGQSSIRVRLFVSGTPQTSASVRVSAPRAGRANVVVPLT